MPASDRVTVRVRADPSMIEEADPFTPTTAGASLRTVTPAVPLAVPVSSSATATLTVTGSADVPLGLSSAYTWAAVKLVTPAARAAEPVEPSPHEIVTE